VLCNLGPLSTTTISIFIASLLTAASQFTLTWFTAGAIHFWLEEIFSHIFFVNTIKNAYLFIYFYQDHFQRPNWRNISLPSLLLEIYVHWQTLTIRTFQNLLAIKIATQQQTVGCDFTLTNPQSRYLKLLNLLIPITIESPRKFFPTLTLRWFRYSLPLKYWRFLMSVFEAEIPFCQLLLYSILYFLGLLGILVLMGLIDKKNWVQLGIEIWRLREMKIVFDHMGGACSV
jgi:hypothetical protein